jgi:HK97 family phage major capsid protein
MTTALRAKNPAPTGNKEVDDSFAEAFGGGQGPVESGPGTSPALSTESSSEEVFDLMLEAAKKLGEKGWYSVGRAISTAYHNKRNPGIPTGLEGEVHQVLSRNGCKHSRAPEGSFRVPWAFERRSGVLTSVTGVGSITAQIQSPADVLRNKMVCARLGAQLLNLTGEGPKGTISVPIRNAASSAQWVTEGNAATASAAQTIALPLIPGTVTAYSPITRRMLSLGQDGFIDFALEELMTSCAYELDRAVIFGSGMYQPLGLARNPVIPSVAPASLGSTGGVMNYTILEQMESLVGQANGDSAADCRLGWITSVPGRSQLRKTDESTVANLTGRYAWKARQHVVNGEIVTSESILGWNAMSTNSVPSGFAMGGGTANLTTILFGNWREVLINTWDSFAVLVNPYAQSVDGTIKASVFLDAASLLRRAASFARCAGWAAS